MLPSNVSMKWNYFIQSKGIPKKFAIDLIKDGFLQLKNQGGENYES